MLAWFRGKSFEEQVAEFDSKINQIATSLVKSSEEAPEDGEYDLANLQDMDVCNEYVIFLSDELDKRFKKIEVQALSDAIYLTKRRKNSQKKEANNLNADNYESSNETKHTKKDLCIKVASHYIRILNLLSAILTSINPQKNMCSRRIEALYHQTKNDVDSGYIRTCKSDDTDRSNPLYTKDIKNIPGIKQLLNIYYFHLMQESISKGENVEVMKEEYEKLMTAFSEIFYLKLDGEENNNNPLKISEKAINESIESLNKTKQENVITDPELVKRVNDMSLALTTIKDNLESIKSSKTNNTSSNLQNIKNTLSNSIKTEIDGVKQTFDSQLSNIKDQVSLLINEIREMNKKPESQGSNLTEEISPEPIGGPTEISQDVMQQMTENITPNNVVTSEQVNTLLNSQKKNSNAFTNNIQQLSEEYSTNMGTNTYGLMSNNMGSTNMSTNMGTTNMSTNMGTTNMSTNMGNTNISTNMGVTNMGTNTTSMNANNMKESLTDDIEDMKNIEDEYTTEDANNNLNIENITPDEFNKDIENISESSTAEPVLDTPEQPTITQNNNKIGINTNKPKQIGGEQNNNVISSRINSVKTKNNMNTENKGNNVNASNTNINTIPQDQLNTIENNATNTNTNTNAKSAVDKFAKFVEKYTKTNNLPDTYNINLKTKMVDDIVNFYECSSKPSRISIRIDDDKYADFNTTYKALKQHYLDSSTTLLDIAVNDLLEKEEGSNNNKKNNEEPVVRYKLKNLTNKELDEIQLNVIHELTEYYTKCQKYYEEAFAQIAESVIPEELYN
jgi:hypothetical protein